MSVRGKCQGVKKFWEGEDGKEDNVTVSKPGRLGAEKSATEKGTRKIFSMREVGEAKNIGEDEGRNTLWKERGQGNEKGDIAIDRDDMLSCWLCRYPTTYRFRI